ncbi:hypothetical protein AG1IA_07281 [Rhizoctonia solani AG-1 IA]|uniref:Uncharacterized protein n=1 Tax=Thanatephorus cucumeris (strain AG1-IA) TaxID=983506 RepID=L8WKF8_THACA|nr:hypothetical protein AG1IA_07281 [Rhizoctonia solani AG-1 IA]
MRMNHLARGFKYPSHILSCHEHSRTCIHVHGTIYITNDSGLIPWPRRLRLWE